MTRSLCTSCGLRRIHCQCHPQDSTAPNANANGDSYGERPFKITPASFCVFYLLYTLVMFGLCLIFYMSLVIPSNGICYLEVFADSFSVSNASNTNATADWNVGFTTRNPGNGCKASLHTMKSRLLRGDKLISESSSPDYFSSLVTRKINDVPLPYAVFETVTTPRNGVVWDLLVEVVTSIKINGRSGHGVGVLIMTCRDLPVNFTADPAGNVKGSLIGYMRPCEYIVQDKYPDISF